eukprot:SAG11_NODE_777_length_7218_cov_24.269420_8_plen_48_part_00
MSTPTLLSCTRMGDANFREVTSRGSRGCKFDPRRDLGGGWSPVDGGT